MKRGLAIALVLVVAGVFFVWVVANRTPPDALADYSSPAQYARALFDDVNTERMAGGELGSLTWSDCLATKALPRAAKTLAEETLTHEPLAATCDANVATGENLSRGAFTPSEITAKWMASPGHEANILRPGFADAGVGCVAMSAADPAKEAQPGEPVGGYACSMIFEGGE